MEYSVKGRVFYPGYVLDILVDREGDLAVCPNAYRAVIFTSGSAFVAVDGVKHFVEAPSVLCLNAAERAEIVKAEAVACHQVFFKPTVINAELTEDRIQCLRNGDEPRSPDSVCSQDFFWIHSFCGAANRLIKLGPSAFERVMGIIDDLTKSLDEQVDLYWPCRSRSYFLEFLFFVRNVASDYPGCLVEPREGTESGDGKFEDILIHLHSGFQGDISLTDLCERFAINRTSLNELFHRHTGKSVIQYLISLRIEFACILLRDTTMPVKEVVFRAGFNDPVNFNRTFKKRTTRSPVDYRREFCFLPTG